VASIPLHASLINPGPLLPLAVCSGRLLSGYGDAARHVGRAVVGGRPMPVEGDPERVARVQRPRVEQPVVGGNVMRVFALVDSPYGRARGDDDVSRIEVVVPDGYHHFLGGRFRLLRPSNGHEREQNKGTEYRRKVPNRFISSPFSSVQLAGVSPRRGTPVPASLACYVTHTTITEGTTKAPVVRLPSHEHRGRSPGEDRIPAGFSYFFSLIRCGSPV
jgi:hypothetical protein